jgi:putative membrane protein
MKALTILAIAAVALVGLAGPAVAQVQSEQDREFVRKAVSGGLAEVELGQLAMDRAVNRAVRSYATRIVQDHNRATAELMALAQRRALAAPATLEASHQAHDRLAGLSGAAFDRAYLQQMLRDHTQDIAEFERATQIVTDPELRAWAARTLPTLHQHLALARQVNTQVVLGPVSPATLPAALPAAVVTPWCSGAYAPVAGSNFGTCAPAQ